MYEQLYAENIRLIKTVAADMRWILVWDHSLDYDDLTQAGFIGIVKAKKTFDSAAGATWAGWASLYMKKEMKNLIRYGRKRNGGRLMPAHIGAESLDAPVSDDVDASTLGEILPDDRIDLDADIERRELRKAVRAAVDRLPKEREKEVIQMCDLNGKDQATAGKALGITPERVRQIRSAALQKLRRDRQLLAIAKAELDYGTPYFARVGPRQFNTTRTSATELAALYRIEHSDKIKRLEGAIKDMQELLEATKPQTDKNDHRKDVSQ